MNWWVEWVLMFCWLVGGVAVFEVVARMTDLSL